MQQVFKMLHFFEIVMKCPTISQNGSIYFYSLQPKPHHRWSKNEINLLSNLLASLPTLQSQICITCFSLSFTVAAILNKSEAIQIIASTIPHQSCYLSTAAVVTGHCEARVSLILIPLDQGPCTKLEPIKNSPRISKNTPTNIKNSLKT